MTYESNKFCSIYRSVIIESIEQKNEFNPCAFDEALSLNVVIKILNPEFSTLEQSEQWQNLLCCFNRLNHVDLVKLVLKHVKLDSRALDNLNEIPLLFDVTERGTLEINTLASELSALCDCDVKQSRPGELNFVPNDFSYITWDPSNIEKSINNLPDPSPWSHRSFDTLVHVVGACASSINAPEGYDVFHAPANAYRSDGKPYRVIYYSESFFESGSFTSSGDIVLLYPGKYYCGWQVKPIFVIPSVEIYGVNGGLHQVDIVGSSHYSDMCSDAGLLTIESSNYQPFPVYCVLGNLTLKARSEGRPITVRGGQSHLLLFNCSIFAAHYPAIVFSPRESGTLNLLRCFVSGSMDSCLVVGRPTTKTLSVPSSSNNSCGSTHKVDDDIRVTVKHCKITKSGRGYLSKCGQSGALTVRGVSELRVENCIIRDNVGHAFQFTSNTASSRFKKRRPDRKQKFYFKNNITKRNQACDKYAKAFPDDLSCCNFSKRVSGCKAVVQNAAPESKLAVRGSHCCVCGQPTRKLCSHCKNAFYCSVKCQMKDWNSHLFYCVA